VTEVELTVDLSDGHIGSHASMLRLGGLRLDTVLEETSWESLSEAVTSTAPRQIMLFTRDGRTIEAGVSPGDGHARVALHDVTRHVEHADRFARMALQLHRQNRDLGHLYEASVALGDTLDVDALVATTARVFHDYLRAQAVVVEAAGRESEWRSAAVSGDPATRRLQTARGRVGHVAWWREAPLRTGEEEVVDLLTRRAAISLDHALLLAPPTADQDCDRFGLLTAAAGRRRLATLRRPQAVALIEPVGGDVEPDVAFARVAAVLAPGRRGDVKARWGGARILVVLEDADRDAVTAWLDRRADTDPSVRWRASVVDVERDLDRAIGRAAADLDRNSTT
jgi:hypothetical protein